jgi:hypothetical protein
MNLNQSRGALLVALLAAALWRPVEAQNSPLSSQPAKDGLPEASSFLRQVRDTIRLDDELQQDFMYLEERRDVKVTRLGRVEVGPQRTFEVYPSNIPGRTYKRLIAIDGKPLDPAELARRDREHQEDLRKAADREKRETAAERANRLREIEEAEQERRAIIEDGLAVFEPRLVRRETIDGYQVVMVTLTPRADARVTTREGRWMKQFEGTVWVSESDHQIVKLDMRARDDVTIGWGVLGRLHEGSRFVFARRKVENVWLPAQITFDASGRTLLLRKFQLNVVTTYSGYKRIS